MAVKRNWHPLQIVGVVLLSNCIAFTALVVFFGLDGFLGMSIGCASAGLVMTIVGFVLSRRDSGGMGDQVSP